MTKYVPFFGFRPGYVTPTQLCSHSQLPRACLAFGCSISPRGCCLFRPLPLTCPAMFVFQQSPDGLWELKGGGGRMSKDGALTQLPTQSNPLLSHFPCSCHRRATGESPPGCQDEHLLPGAPEYSPSQTCWWLQLVCRLEPRS